MRSFNTNFNTERAKRGTGPVNLIKFGFATPVYLSDRDVTPSGGPAYSGLVKSWGFIDTSIKQTPGQGVLGTIEVSDFEAVIVNSEATPFSDNFTATDPPENVTVELYQWFQGTTDAEKEIIFKGAIYGQPEYDLYECRLAMRGIWELYNRRIGEDLIITADDFPSADPDDIGKMQNICYGSLSRVPCRAVESGGVDNLVDEVTASQTSIELSDASEFATSGTIGIDDEEITYTGKSGNTLTGCTRGANSTTATTHADGSVVWEILSRYVYQVAGHPVKSIGDIFVEGMRITSVATTYTGQTGDELTGFEDQAVFTVPSRLTRQQAVDILVNDGIQIDDAIQIVDTVAIDDEISISDTFAVADTIGVDVGSHSHSVAGGSQEVGTGTHQASTGTVTNATNAVDDDAGTYTTIGDGTGYSYATYRFSYSGSGTVTRVDVEFRVADAPYYGYRATIQVGSETAQNFWVATGTTETLTHSFTGSWSNDVKITAYTALKLYEIFKVTIYYSSSPTDASPSTGVAKTGAATFSGEINRGGTITIDGGVTRSGYVTRSGAVTLSGNSVADVEIGRLLTCDLDGQQDDGSGTYTGTPNALIERPDHVFKHVWVELLSAPSGDIDSTTFTAAGTFYATNSYAFALLISQPVQAEELLMRLALQCRSRFFVTAYGTAKLIVRQTGQSSVHSIVKNEIKEVSISIKRSATTDLINQFNIRYDLDHSKGQNSAESYQAVKAFSDSTSISRYGTREWKGAAELFYFDAVTAAAMANHVGTFLLAYHAYVRKMPNWSVFLDNMEIEPGDVVDITHPLDSMSGFTCDVLKILHHLGSAERKIIDHLEVVAIEN